MVRTQETAHQQVHRQLKVLGLGVVISILLSAPYSVFALFLKQLLNGADTNLDITDMLGSVYFGLVCGIPISTIPSIVIGGMTSLLTDEVFRVVFRKLSPLSAIMTGFVLCIFISGMINGVFFFYSGSLALNQGYVVFLLIPSIIYILAGGWGGWFLYTRKYQ